MIREIVIIYGEELLGPRQAQAGGPTLVGSPVLSIDYISATMLQNAVHSFLHPQSEDEACRGDRNRLIQFQLQI